MDIESIIESRGVRLATTAAALLLAATLVLRVYGIPPWTTGTLFLALTIVVGVIAFIGLIHSFRALYYRWLTFAALLQGVMLTLLFGGCYLLVVPWFALVARAINRRGRLEAGTFWLPRRRTVCDERYFTRMG